MSEEVIQAGSTGMGFRLSAEHARLLSKPTSSRGKLQRAGLAVLLEHEADGALPTSGRFVFYELEQRGVVSKLRTGARRADQDLIDAVKYLRDVGIVPWNWLVDERRRMRRYDVGAVSIAGGVRALVNTVRLDPWAGEPAPLLLCESAAVAGVLDDLANKYCCNLTATSGQVGGFLHTDVAPELADKQHVLYLGDHEPQASGEQIEANTRRVLEQYAALCWERLAITREQATCYNLPRSRSRTGAIDRPGPIRPSSARR